MTNPVISFVVIGRNEGERLTRCLESIGEIRGVEGEVDVIYVDSASTDDSVQRARAQGARVLEVRPERPSAALGRNAGWKEAQAPFILFLDGDTILHPDFTAQALAAMQDPSVAVVWGHRREIQTGTSVFNRVLDLDWIYPAGLSEFCGGDALMRRAVLEDVGGFDSTLIAGEEPELCQRIRGKGLQILHLDVPMTGHDLAMTQWSQYWRRAVRAGHAYAEVSDRTAGGPYPLWQEDSRRNVQRGGVLLALIIGGPVLSLILQNGMPLAATVLLLTALVLRTAWKARWKSGEWVTLLLYGMHSHLQQLPILFGQLGYWRDRRRGQRRGLIEYK